jgi:L-seryl-tRNA(Ser) seleniumtransferase
LARSGARLVEVGTTNRTRVEDYARAVGPNTACLLRVHPSNFKMTGFAERPSLSELARLARERGIPLVKDLGGGLVVELPEALASGADRAREPSVQQCLGAGVDLVCFSLDKLFGGPQGGVVAGDAALVQKLREDPLARALRVDKLTLAALEPVISAYERGAPDEIPIHALLCAEVSDLDARARGWMAAADLHHAEVISSEAAIGGGTLSEAPLPSRALAVACDDPEARARQLRNGSPAVLARIEDGRVVLDARTVFPGQDPDVARALRRVFGG